MNTQVGLEERREGKGRRQVEGRGRRSSVQSWVRPWAPVSQTGYESSTESEIVVPFGVSNRWKFVYSHSTVHTSVKVNGIIANAFASINRSTGLIIPPRLKL